MLACVALHLLDALRQLPPNLPGHFANVRRRSSSGCFRWEIVASAIGFNSGTEPFGHDDRSWLSTLRRAFEEADWPKRVDSCRSQPVAPWKRTQTRSRDGGSWILSYLASACVGHSGRRAFTRPP